MLLDGNSGSTFGCTYNVHIYSTYSLHWNQLMSTKSCPIIRVLLTTKMEKKIFGTLVNRCQQLVHYAHCVIKFNLIIYTKKFLFGKYSSLKLYLFMLYNVWAEARKKQKYNITYTMYADSKTFGLYMHSYTTVHISIY